MSAKKRVLFVDDEQAVLEGLEDRFLADARRWELLFACGGEAALRELARHPVAVIVSDMRMPGMDGVELLTEVQRAYPATARIVLTGHADREAIFRALRVAHRLLSKPCDADTLRAAIERTCELHQSVQDPKIRSLVGKLSQVPSVPKLYARLTEAAADPRTGLSDFVQIVSSDPTMGAKVLQLSNSAYFGMRQQVTSVQQAVTYLGVELIRGLALAGGLFSASANWDIEECSIDRLQRFALLTARVAKQLLSDRRLAEEAFTAGLVHDLGRFVLAQGATADYRDLLREARATGRPLWAIERERIGTTHAEVGAYLLGVWGLPFGIVEAVAYHHEPSRVSSGDRQVLAAVHAAAALVDEALEPAERESALDRGFLTQAGLGEHLDRWRAIVQGEVAGLEQAA